MTASKGSEAMGSEFTNPPGPSEKQPFPGKAAEFVGEAAKFVRPPPGPGVPRETYGGRIEKDNRIMNAR